MPIPDEKSMKLIIGSARFLLTLLYYLAIYGCSFLACASLFFSFAVQDGRLAWLAVGFAVPVVLLRFGPKLIASRQYRFRRKVYAQNRPDASHSSRDSD